MKKGNKASCRAGTIISRHCAMAVRAIKTPVNPITGYPRFIIIST